LTVDEDVQFSEAMAGVKPLKVAVRADIKTTISQSPGVAERRASAIATPAIDSNYLSEEHAPPPVGAYDVIGFVRPGVQHGVYGKLRRGRYQPDALLDLHRMTVAQARVEVWGFLREAFACQMRTVMILHGKGDRSPRGPVLKSFVAQWLKHIPEVLAYHSAQPRHGGAGALYVLLKKSEPARESNRERYSK
jgi:DNA-nicking Smr family endonuclease